MTHKVVVSILTREILATRKGTNLPFTHGTSHSISSLDRAAKTQKLLRRIGHPKSSSPLWHPRQESHVHGCQQTQRRANYGDALTNSRVSELIQGRNMKHPACIDLNTIQPETDIRQNLCFTQTLPSAQLKWFTFERSFSLFDYVTLNVVKPAFAMAPAVLDFESLRSLRDSSTRRHLAWKTD
jgi:hypothetical protein